MNQINVVSPVVAENQEDAPSGYVLWMGFDQVATEETGVLHLVEFPIPENASQHLAAMITECTVIEITVWHSQRYNETFMSMPCIFNQVIPFMVGISN